MGRGDTFAFYNYNSDSGSDYAIKLSTAVAAAGSFVQITGSVSGSKVWPFGAHNMRHVLGKSSSGLRTRLPISTNSNTLYQTGGSFTLGGVTYGIEGIIGEKRKLNTIA